MGDVVYDEYDVPSDPIDTDQNYYERGFDIEFVNDIFDSKGEIPPDVWNMLIGNPTYENISKAIRAHPNLSDELNSEAIWARLYDRDFGFSYSDEEYEFIEKGDGNSDFRGWKSAYIYRMHMRNVIMNENPESTLINGSRHVVKPGLLRNMCLVKGQNLLLMHWNNKNNSDRTRWWYI